MQSALRPVHRWIQAYFLVQAFALVIWWGCLLWRTDWIDGFQPSAWPRDVLRSFMLPDGLLLGVGSLLVAWSIQCRAAWSTPAIWGVALAAWYPTLYCIAVSVQTGEAWIASSMMVAMSGLSLAMATVHGGTGSEAAPFHVVDWHFRKAVGWTFLQVLIFWGTFLWVLPMGVMELERRLGGVTFSHRGQSGIGMVVFGMASALGAWSALAMSWWGRGTPLPTATASRLVESGPYALVRNPMACAGIAQGFAVGWGMGSPMVMAYALFGGVVWHVCVRPVEELDMLQRFGEDYVAYQRRVGLWVPRWPRRG